MRSLLIVALLLALAAPAAADLSGRARVIDGNTLELAGETLCLQGVDAPEPAQLCRLGEQVWPCGQVATAKLTEAVLGRDLICSKSGGAGDACAPATCFLGEENVGLGLVSKGWALAAPDAPADLKDARNRAVMDGSGVWAGDFVPPWDWRDGERMGPATEPGCTPCSLRHSGIAERRKALKAAEAGADSTTPAP